MSFAVINYNLLGLKMEEKHLSLLKIMPWNKKKKKRKEKKGRRRLYFQQPKKSLQHKQPKIGVKKNFIAVKRLPSEILAIGCRRHATSQENFLNFYLFSTSSSCSSFNCSWKLLLFELIFFYSLQIIIIIMEF